MCFSFIPLISKLSLAQLLRLDDFENFDIDENQIPASYILQPRESEYKEYSNWEEEEKYLRNILQNAANKLFTLKYTYDIILIELDYKFNLQDDRVKFNEITIRSV